MTQIASPTVRFAPSPTGRLHIGNMRTALFNWIFAKKNGGQFVLRLDDTDQERSTKEFADGIVEDLAWLGITPDRIEKQSDRFALYGKAADDLREKGLIYPCYESPDEIDRRRKRLMARGLPPVYDRAALKLSREDIRKFEDEGRKPHWRFLLPNFESDPFSTQRTEVHFNDLIKGEQTVDLASMSDPVLIRGDGTYLYTLPSVVDDIDMGMTHVIRGGDHVSNTGVQIAIFEALDGPVPQFGHHNLLQDAAGDGLSKRSGALSVSSLRAEGFEPMTIASLATLIGTGQAVEVFSNMEALGDHFDPTKVSKSDAKFDTHDLELLNEKLLHQMPHGEAKSRLEQIEADLGEQFWAAVQPNLSKFEDVISWRSVVLGDFQPVEQEQADRDYLTEAAALLPAEPWEDDIWSQWTSAVKSKTGRKGRNLFMPLRLALTGLDHGPDMKLFLPIIGWENTRRRLP